jgi:hypothetical protein
MTSLFTVISVPRGKPSKKIYTDITGPTIKSMQRKITYQKTPSVVLSVGTRGEVITSSAINGQGIDHKETQLKEFQFFFFTGTEVCT